jgi:hypothetical protein
MKLTSAERETLVTLLRWHGERGVEAMRRAERATSDECIAANEETATAHRVTVEMLAKLVP